MYSKETLANWSCRDSKTKLDTRIKSARTIAVEHPLQRFSAAASSTDIHPSVSKSDNVKKKDVSFADPLGFMLDGDDPLSLFQRQAAQKDKYEDNWNMEIPIRSKLKASQPWEVKKEEILAQFNSQEILSMSSCLSHQDKSTSHGNRQEDDLEEGIIFEHDLTPNEFFKKIQGFHDEVIHAWEDDQRVKAIKIVIQCSKLLSDSLSCSFYPKKFIYITDILDTFGNLVYTRLKIKCQELWKPDTYNGCFIQIFPENFTIDIVPEAAKETCYNWFYKIASIRELIPRLYVEISLLRSYTFIKSGEFDIILSRLTKMMRGVGDPLVNIYLRCYICRVAATCFEHVSYNFFAENFFEFVTIYRTIFTSELVVRKAVNLAAYLEAFVPALEWIVQGLVINDESVQYSLLDSFQITDHNALLLLVTMASFKSSFIISQIPAVLQWITECNYEEVPIHKLIRQLGLCFEKHSDEHLSVIDAPVLNQMWKLINKIENTLCYINCVEQWLQLSVSNLTVKQIDSLLGEIVSHVQIDGDPSKFYPQLQNIVRYLMETVHEFLNLVISESFMPFLRLFRNETTKLNVNKIVMESFIKRSNETFITDQVILNNMMTIAKWLHDSINALTVEDEKKQIGKLLSSFVIRIDFGRDFEQQLEFFVDARGSFFNLSVVHVILVHRVNKLIIDTLKIVKGRHTSRTSAFVRACSAYCFITIPSLTSPVTRLQLYMLSGQTALANQCLGQADAFFKAAIETIPEFPKKLEGLTESSNSDHIVMSYIRELYSILLVVPDNPTESTSLTLIRLLSNILLKYPWTEPNSARISMYIQALHVLNSSYQSEFPYHFLNVDSNDLLYASDIQFKNDIKDMCSVLLHQIYKSLVVLGESKNTKLQAKLAYELFFCILTRADVANIEMAKLAVNLWNLANKHETVDKSIAVTTLNRCIQMSPPNSKYTEVFSKLLAKLE